MQKISTDRTLLAASILARGFVDDPMWKFILPRSQNRLQILTAMFEVFVDDGIKRGEVLLASQERGAVIWYPAEVNIFDSTFVDVEAKINTIAANFNELDAIQRLEQIGRKVQPIAPTIPHHEIFWLATIPEFRGKGIGSRLLKSILDDADAQKASCYLVSSNPNNILFYQARGFQQYSLISIDSKLTLIAMWRGSYPSNFTLVTNN